MPNMLAIVRDGPRSAPNLFDSGSSAQNSKDGASHKCRLHSTNFVCASLLECSRLTLWYSYSAPTPARLISSKDIGGDAVNIDWTLPQLVLGMPRLVLDILQTKHQTSESDDATPVVSLRTRRSVDSHAVR